MLKIEESDGSMLKFTSYNSFGRQTHPILVEGKGAFEVIYPKGDNGKMRFHRLVSAERRGLATRYRERPSDLG